MKRITYLVLSLLILSSLLAGGCSCDGVIPPAGEGGTLSLYGIDPYTLDPALSGEMTSHVYLMQLFSGLVRFDDNMEPAPDIAERWEVDSGGRTYTFYLRQDVKFHDGRKLTAEDFKYSWERACAPRTGSLTAATYLGDIVGVAEVIAALNTRGRSALVFPTLMPFPQATSTSLAAIVLAALSPASLKGKVLITYSTPLAERNRTAQSRARLTTAHRPGAESPGGVPPASHSKLSLGLPRPGPCSVLTCSILSLSYYHYCTT